MKEPSVYILKKYLTALNKINRKYVTAERLSKILGVYPEVISNNLSYFEPMIIMDYEYNLMDLVPQIKAHLKKIEAKKAKAKADKLKAKAINTKDKKKGEEKVVKAPKVKYASIGDFVYKKMTFGGMVDKSIKLSEEDLKALQVLVNKALKSKGAK